MSEVSHSIKDVLKKKYGTAARRASTGSCCGTGCGSGDSRTADLDDAGMGLWIGCIAGALQDAEYRTKLSQAGFGSIQIEPTRVYSLADARQFLSDAGIDVAVGDPIEGKFVSAFIRAVKSATIGVL